MDCAVKVMQLKKDLIKRRKNILHERIVQVLKNVLGDSYDGIRYIRLADELRDQGRNFGFGVGGVNGGEVAEGELVAMFIDSYIIDLCAILLNM